MPRSVWYNWQQRRRRGPSIPVSRRSGDEEAARKQAEADT